MEFDLNKALETDLKEDWENLFKSVGVESLDELASLEKAKKDLTKLIPVKKQITRGGRTMETTVYVSPEEAKDMKQGKKPDEKKVKKEKKEKAPKRSSKKSDFHTEVIAPYDAAVKDIRKQLESWKNNDMVKALNDSTKDHYLIANQDKSGKVNALGAFKRVKDMLVMPHFGSLGEIKGAGMQIIRKLVDKANSMGLGVEVNPPKGSAKTLIDFGFKDELNGTLVMDSETVKKVSEGNNPKEETKEPEKSSEKPDEDSKADTKEQKEASKKEEAPEKSKEEQEAEAKQKEHDKVKKELKKVRKSLGSDQYRACLEHHGIKWEKNDHQGVNTMRASMAASTFIKEGGKLDMKSFLKESGNTEDDKK